MLFLEVSAWVVSAPKRLKGPPFEAGARHAYLGKSTTIAMTMRYAHPSPSYLDSVLKQNSCSYFICNGVGLGGRGLGFS